MYLFSKPVFARRVPSSCRAKRRLSLRRTPTRETAFCSAFAGPTLLILLSEMAKMRCARLRGSLFRWMDQQRMLLGILCLLLAVPVHVQIWCRCQCVGEGGRGTFEVAGTIVHIKDYKKSHHCRVLGPTSLGWLNVSIWRFGIEETKSARYERDAFMSSTSFPPR